jgi:RNA polymerase sigma-70 factor (sigma-E family)
MHISMDASATGAVLMSSSDDRYAELFTAHRVAVLRLANLLAGDRYVAEEVTAEVFARVLVKWRRGVVDEPLHYLRRAVVNEVRSRHRRLGYERRALARYGNSFEVGESTDRLALREPLVTALSMLPARQRAVVVLRYHEDLSEAEVARTLRVSIGTVKTHASRGLEQLRILLKEDL